MTGRYVVEQMYGTYAVVDTKRRAWLRRQLRQRNDIADEVYDDPGSIYIEIIGSHPGEVFADDFKEWSEACRDAMQRYADEFNEYERSSRDWSQVSIDLPVRG